MPTTQEEKKIAEVIAQLEGFVHSHVSDPAWGFRFAQSSDYAEAISSGKPVATRIDPHAVLYETKAAPRMSYVTIYPDGRLVGKLL